MVRLSLFVVSSGVVAAGEACERGILTDEPIPEEECPKCGNTKHQEVIRIETEDKESRVWRCKACGHTEYDFSEYSNGKDSESVEKMGDAFRDFLKK